MSGDAHPARSAEVLAAKIALEDELVEPLGYALSSYIETWARNDGNMSMADQIAFAGMVESVLMRHYARTIAVMSGTVPTAETTLDQVALSPSTVVRLKNRARNQTMHMLRGVDRDLAAALSAMPLLKHALGGGTLEQKRERLTVAMAARFRETAKQAWAKLKSRMRAIVNLETESVSEQHQIEWVKQKHANSRIYKTWHNPMDGKERPWHHAAHVEYSDTGIPVDQPFVVGGEQLMQPGDSSRGASLANLINCFPGDTRVSGAVVAATRHFYAGDIIEIVTRGGHKLAGTPNHPVLTAKGWIALGALDEGDDLIRAGIGRKHDGLATGVVSTGLDGAHHVENIEPQVQEVFDALSVRGRAVRPVGLAVNFHGDIPTHDVDIVGADRVLWCGVDPTRLQRSHEFSLRFPDLGAGRALPDRLAVRLGSADARAASGSVGGARQLLPVVGARLSHARAHPLASVAGGDAGIQQSKGNFPATDTEFNSDSLHRPSSIEHLCNPVPDSGSVVASPLSVGTAERSHGARLAHPIVDRCRGDAGALTYLGNGQPAAIEIDSVVSVRREAFAGHVFNLQTVHGIYHANGFVVHNCRCHAAYHIIGPNNERIDIPLQTPALPARRTWHPGDRLGVETPVRPTEAITMTGRTRATVVLGDGRTMAQMVQVAPDTVVVRASGRDLARATFAGDRVTSLVTAPDTAGLDLDGLVRRSVAASSGGRSWRQVDS